MSGKAVTLRTHLAWYEWLGCLLAGFFGYTTTGARWTALLCALAAGIAFGVWRVVAYQAAILEHVQAVIYQDQDSSVR